MVANAPRRYCIYHSREGRLRCCFVTGRDCELAPNYGGIGGREGSLSVFVQVLLKHESAINIMCREEPHYKIDFKTETLWKIIPLNTT